MAKKKFKTESQKLLNMMINSIYTHKEIFLRELISNASDAIDKLYYRSLTDQSVGLSRSDFEIEITLDKDSRMIVIRDNGCGMSRDDLENNLGTIAKSGSFDFKNSNESKEDVDIIGQFGVGFYSAFMVSDKITVKSKAFGSDEANIWESEGVEGYTVNPCEMDSHGSVITLHIKPDTEEEKYGDFLESYRITSLIKKYSDYIRYPIKMETTRQELKEGTEDEYETMTEKKTLNSMIPIWKKNPKDITEEEYNSFYTDKFSDYEAPLKVIHSKTEGKVTYDALMFIPSRAPYNYYSKDYEKGLQLYSSGVMITEKCADLLPDFFSFMKGLVDSADLSLNISRETLQHDYQLKAIAKAIEKKIKSELEKLLSSEREKYETFYKAFGMQLKYGLYSGYGMNKDLLQDLILFTSSAENKPVTFKEYISRIKEDQKSIYYACGETIDKISMLPQVEAVRDKGFEVLYLTDDVDEFALKMLGTYDEKNFLNVCAEELDISSEEEKNAVKSRNESAADLLKFMKESLGDSVNSVRFTNTLKNHPVSLSSEGGLSVEMEKIMSKMPDSDSPMKASLVLEINSEHPIAAKLEALYENDKEKLSSYAKILYSQARLISGMSVENPSELSSLICDLMI